MNGLYYPQDVVANAAPQLEMLPAPAGHPNLDGKPISAFNPLAVNAHSFGGFTRSPEVDGKRVMLQLVIDTDVADRTEDGREVVQRIKNGKRIGVSTGLVAAISDATGTVGTAQFNGRVDTIRFDHVAVLLDGLPAGENTYTLNHDKSQNQPRPMFMDKLELDLTSLAVADRVMLGDLTVNQLLDHVNHSVTVEEATNIVIKAGFQVNQLKSDVIEDYVANADEFTAFKAKRQEATDETVQFILDNSKMTKEQLDGMDPEALETLSQSVAPKNKHVTNRGKGTDPELVLLDDNVLPAKEV